MATLRLDCIETTTNRESREVPTVLRHVKEWRWSLRLFFFNTHKRGDEMCIAMTSRRKSAAVHVVSRRRKRKLRLDGATCPRYRS